MHCIICGVLFFQNFLQLLKSIVSYLWVKFLLILKTFVSTTLTLVGREGLLLILFHNVVAILVLFLFQLMESVDNPVKTPCPGVVSFLCFVCRDKLSNATLCNSTKVTTLE